MGIRPLAVALTLITLAFEGVMANAALEITESELADILGLDRTDIVNPRSLKALKVERRELLGVGEPAADAEVKRVKTRYGPFTVPPVTVNGGMKSYLQMEGVQKPCSNCSIIVAKPGLEFADGSYANANTSMWLHHIQIYNSARWDTTCPVLPERMMASGNERTSHVYSVPG